MFGQFRMALELYKGMLKTRTCKPDELMMSTIVNGLSKCGCLKAAHDMLRRYENSGYNPDIYTYSALINGFVQEARIDDAQEVMAQMLAKGVHPDVVTYTSIL
ncbi:Pentatricopeptide repeat-containing protein [Striga hermonthica]|uniref:Pentatricopeptide repeat-containing protein n=1 Tax=Striga hermonthica TaxID=68872 RepID=A0A9N7P241_STRHE|nr:Pentatricopeptide repeat-containing protein [Striga hermonthica]